MNGDGANEGDGAGGAGGAEAARSLLLVDDDQVWLQRLAVAMGRRGFAVVTAASVQEAIVQAREHAPDYAVIDLRLEDGSGLDVVSALREVRPNGRIIMLTGYGNIATAVAAVKLGAVDYLSKPADADAIEAALLAENGEIPALPAGL